jgi:hypothetical protein
MHEYNFHIPFKIVENPKHAKNVRLNYPMNHQGTNEIDLEDQTVL